MSAQSRRRAQQHTNATAHIGPLSLTAAGRATPPAGDES